jgi:nitrite reductase (NO-forming)
MKSFVNGMKGFFTGIGLLAVLLTGACAPAVKVEAQAGAQATQTTALAGPTATNPSASPSAGEGTLTVGKNPALGKPDVTFTLKTGMADGKLVFIGAGGEIDGKANPDLQVSPGQVVEIDLVDADGMLHDLAAPDFGVKTEQVTPQNKEAGLTFKADKAGTFAYYCTIPGHRQAGMEGRIVVGQAAPTAAAGADISRAPDDLPGPLNRSTPENVRVDLETVERQGRLADGVTYTYWTFNGKVPGPMIRVRVGDTVEVHLKNSAGSSMNHSVDFHAVTGPGGGAVATQTQPGQETSFTFKALNPGLYVYHCATPMVAEHIANGMYGMILVEPEGGLPKVDREFYVMQGEIYTNEKMNTPGLETTSVDKLLDEQPEYFVLNGAVGALTTDHPLHANVGETVRIFYGVGGPNYPSSFHVIGEIFDRVYDQGSLTSAPLTNVQTTLVPAGGSTIVEFQIQVPGRYILLDHSLSRMERGLAGYLLVDGDANPSIFSGTLTPGSGH